MPVDDGVIPRQDIPDDVRTEGRDEAFKKLEALREEGRLYGRAMTDLEDEVGWSRQHLANVLRDYYQQENGETASGVRMGDAGRRVQLDVEIPDDIERPEEFLRGYVQGLLAEDG